LKREFNNEEGLDLATTGVQTINDIASLRWRKRWSGFVRTSAGIAYRNNIRECPSAGTQSIRADAELSILARRWIEFGAGISNLNHSADTCSGVDTSGLDFDVQQITAFVRLSL